MKRPPSRGSSWASTSARRTGSCALSSLDPEVLEVVGDAGLDGCEVGAPASGLPDLEVVGVPDDDRFVAEARVFAEVRRDREPPLRVGVTLVSSGEQEMAETRRGGIRPRALCDG